MKKIVRVLIVGIFLGIFACYGTSPTVVQASSNMPQFELKSAVDGKVVESDQFEGKVLLVSFFAIWCQPCLEEIPSFKELQKEFGEDGFSVVAMSIDFGAEKQVAKLIEKRGINYPVLMADTSIMDGFGGIYNIPVSFLVNREGEVLKRYTGYMSASSLAKDIKTVMN